MGADDAARVGEQLVLVTGAMDEEVGRPSTTRTWRYRERPRRPADGSPQSPRFRSAPQTARAADVDRSYASDHCIPHNSSVTSRAGSALFETRARSVRDARRDNGAGRGSSVSPRRAAQARRRSRRSRPPATAAWPPSDPTAPCAVGAAARSQLARAPAPPAPPLRRQRRRTQC
jgi:hypothetical protein